MLIISYKKHNEISAAVRGKRILKGGGNLSPCPVVLVKVFLHVSYDGFPLCFRPQNIDGRFPYIDR